MYTPPLYYWMILSLSCNNTKMANETIGGCLTSTSSGKVHGNNLIYSNFLVN
jgi:hypothetical protein